MNINILKFSSTPFVMSIYIFIAELIFLYSFPKRRFFAIRYPLTILLITFFVSHFSVSFLTPFFQINQFLNLLYIFGFTYLGMLFCFKSSPLSIFFVCVAGYGIEHISYHISKIISLTGIFNNITFAFNSNSISREIFCFPIFYFIAFLTFGMYAKENQIYKNFSLKNSIISIILIFICLGITRLINPIQNALTTIGISLYAIFCCTFAIIIQFYNNKMVLLSQENKIVKFIIKEQRKQYDVTQKNIDIINAKCHDLKHRLSSLQNNISSNEINDLTKAIDLYETQIETGYNALDVLIKEKSLICNNQNIKLTCLGNGAALKFINESDAYALFGNAIDNAINAVLKIEQIEKRVINITIEEKQDFCNINFSNFFEGDLTFEKGLPTTTKVEEPGYHGFGIKSIKYIAEKYHGGIDICTSNGIFNLNIYVLKK